MPDILGIRKRIENGSCDEKLIEIYADEKRLDEQKKRYLSAVCQFETLFGTGEAEVYSAPGRSEIAGNHTDHQRGRVLAAAVNLDAIAVVRKRTDSRIRLLSKGYEMIELDLNHLEVLEEEKETTNALVRGMAYGLKKKGYTIGGFEAYITSDVLGGAGLSSSAAFEILVGTIFSGLYNEMQIDAVAMAQVAQYAENVYFGKPCGLMDQMACSVGGLIAIDFADEKNPLIEKVKVDFASYGHSLCITDTKGSHADLTDEYAAVPREMKQVADYFGEEVLREVEEKEFWENVAQIREQLGDRPVLRAIHFFEENRRVLAQVEALQKGEFEEFLKLIKQSGSSSFQYLQNVYANSDVQNQAVAIGIAVSESILKDKGVCRVHGGGFAGTIQAFVEDEFVETYENAMNAVYGEGACHILRIRKVGGIRVL